MSKLLLAVAKTKGAALPEEQKAELLRAAARVVAPRIGELAVADLIKIVLALASQGRTELLEAATLKAIDRVS